MSQNPRNPIILEVRNNTNLNGFVTFVMELGIPAQIVLSCKLQSKQPNKQKVSVPKAQDPMVLIGELVKALNLYSNPRVAQNSNVNKNSNARGASKKFSMQKAQSN